MKRWSKLEIAGWLIAIASGVFLAARLIVRHVTPSLAESRRMAPREITGGAWWYTGKRAPAGEAVDLTGVWLGTPIGDITEALIPGQELVFTPEGKHRWETVDHARNPTNSCLPPGPVRNMLMMLPAMIVQRPDVVAILSEYQRTYRIIYTDGRGHESDATEYPEWMGDSIGHWEGGTLIVDTIGLHERSWLDVAGHEHSDQLHLIERYRLIDADAIEVELTVEDPVFFVKPFTTRRILRRQVGDRILDYACLENEKDLENLQPTFGDAGR